MDAVEAMTSPTSEEKLESCPVCGALPIDQVDTHAVRELVRNPHKLSRQEILDDCSFRRSPSRREVLEEAARVARSIQFTDSRGMQAGLRIASAIRALAEEN